MCLKIRCVNLEKLRTAVQRWSERWKHWHYQSWFSWNSKQRPAAAMEALAYLSICLSRAHARAPASVAAGRQLHRAPLFYHRHPPGARQQQLHRPFRFACGRKRIGRGGLTACLWRRARSGKAAPAWPRDRGLCSLPRPPPALRLPAGRVRRRGRGRERRGRGPHPSHRTAEGVGRGGAGSSWWERWRSRCWRSSDAVPPDARAGSGTGPRPRDVRGGIGRRGRVRGRDATCTSRANFFISSLLWPTTNGPLVGALQLTSGRAVYILLGFFTIGLCI
jgi:hypothetical protein